MNANKQIAVYWDFENIHLSLGNQQFGSESMKASRFQKQARLMDIPAIMEWIESLGQVRLNRAYANWSFLSAYSHDLQTHCIDLVQLFHRGSHAKNGADIRLAVDVVEDLGRHDHQIDLVIVIGGDSDYIAVAQKVREQGHHIYGLGVQDTTNPYWVRACHQFKFYHELVPEQLGHHHHHGHTQGFSPLSAPTPLAINGNQHHAPHTGRLNPALDEDQMILSLNHRLHDTAERYRRILRDQQVRLVPPLLLSQAIRQSWAVFAHDLVLSSFDHFRHLLRDRMLEQHDCSETDLVKIKAILFKAHFFSIDPQVTGVRRDPALTTPEEAIWRVQSTLIRRIAMEAALPLNLEVLQMLLPDGHLLDHDIVSNMHTTAAFA